MYQLVYNNTNSIYLIFAYVTAKIKRKVKVLTRKIGVDYIRGTKENMLLLTEAF